MITEDYVSFEVAKLMKEKGFDERCFSFYWSDGSLDANSHDNKTNLRNSTSLNPVAPTFQMAMKWLREVHNLVIEPYVTACGYLYTISRLPFGSTCYDNGSAYNGDDEDSGQWTTWEKACEDGIKYCLENLI